MRHLTLTLFDPVIRIPFLSLVRSLCVCTCRFLTKSDACRCLTMFIWISCRFYNPLQLNNDHALDSSWCGLVLCSPFSKMHWMSAKKVAIYPPKMFRSRRREFSFFHSSHKSLWFRILLVGTFKKSYFVAGSNSFVDCHVFNVKKPINIKSVWKCGLIGD